jgi:hypothetical protein
MRDSLFLIMPVCALVSAKWAMELGFNQFRQLLWAIAGFFTGPLALLVLYVRLLYQQRDEQRIKREMPQSFAKEI